MRLDDEDVACAAWVQTGMMTPGDGTSSLGLRGRERRGGKGRNWDGHSQTSSGLA